MTYKEIYSSVFADDQVYRTTKERITGIAKLVFRHGYKDFADMTKEDAFWLACELYEDMTGRYFDPTNEEYEQMLTEIH